MDVQLKIGTDDGVAVWLNGQEAHARNVHRALTVDQDVTQAHLNAGTNTLLVKVTQVGGGWAMCVRLVDMQNKPVAYEGPKGP
jgi:hypothetical protein